MANIKSPDREQSAPSTDILVAPSSPFKDATPLAEITDEGQVFEDIFGDGTVLIARSVLDMIDAGHLEQAMEDFEYFRTRARLERQQAQQLRTAEREDHIRGGFVIEGYTPNLAKESALVAQQGQVGLFWQSVFNVSYLNTRPTRYSSPELLEVSGPGPRRWFDRRNPDQPNPEIQAAANQLAAIKKQLQALKESGVNEVEFQICLDNVADSFLNTRYGDRFLQACRLTQQGVGRSDNPYETYASNTFYIRASVSSLEIENIDSYCTTYDPDLRRDVTHHYIAPMFGLIGKVEKWVPESVHGRKKVPGHKETVNDFYRTIAGLPACFVTDITPVTDNVQDADGRVRAQRYAAN